MRERFDIGYIHISRRLVIPKKEFFYTKDLPRLKPNVVLIDRDINRIIRYEDNYN